MFEYATLGEMADHVGIQIQDTSSSKADAIKLAINMHYGQLAREHRWKELLRISEEKFSTSSGQKYLYLPKEVEQLYLVFPQGGMPPLTGMSLDQMIEQFSSGYDTAGATIAFADAGEVGYRADFHATGEQLVIRHSGTQACQAVIRGMILGQPGTVAATEIVEKIALAAGSGGVGLPIGSSVTTSNTFTELGAVSVTELADDDVVSVIGATSGTVYAVIAAGERTARYKRIRLMQPEDGSELVTIVWKKRVARLKENNQALEIPVGNVLIDMTVATMLAGQREYGGATMHYQRARRDIDELKSATEVDTAAVQIAIPGVSTRRGYQFGGRF